MAEEQLDETYTPPRHTQRLLNVSKRTRSEIESQPSQDTNVSRKKAKALIKVEESIERISFVSGMAKEELVANWAVSNLNSDNLMIFCEHILKTGGLSRASCTIYNN